MRPRSSSAFTLTELVIVVIIIGVLAGVAAVNHRTQKGRAEYMHALTNAQSLANAVKNYIYSGGTVQATGTTSQSESFYKIALPEGTFTRYSVSGSGNTFTISARYNPTGNASSSDQTVFTWSSDGNLSSCSGANCGIS